MVGDTMKKSLIMFFSILALVGCGKKEENKKEEIEIKKEVSVKTENLKLKYGEEVLNTKGIVEIENGTLLTEESNIDTSVLGTQAITIRVKDEEGNEKEFTYEVDVIDDVKPVITYKKKLTTTEGVKIDLTKNVTVKDNTGEKIKVNVEGSYDFNKVGTYKLYYVAKDSSGNEAKEEFSLVVNKKPEEKKVETTTENKSTEKTEEKTSTTTKTTSGSTAKAGKGTDSSLNGTKTSKGYTITVKNGVTYIDGVMIANKTYALPSSYVPSGTQSKLSGAYKEISKTGIISNAYSAYTKMQSAAKSAGYSISIASGYRSYGYQEGLYNGYVKKNGKADADLGSARPGHSEHQTGLAFDLNTISNSSDNTKTTKWVLRNCYKYGFILRYPKGKTGSTGYKYEWWHLRYVGVDLATKLYNGGNWITLEEHFGITSKYDY